MSIVINTPSGNIGGHLARILLDVGEAVTVISRSPEKVADLAARGARVVAGSMDDAGVLDQAFEGAHGVFWLNPPPARPDFAEWGIAAAKTAAATAKKHGVKMAAVLSSVGAQHGPGSGPVGVLQTIEHTFERALPNVVMLRAGFFMENLFRDVHGIQSGTIYSAAPADAKMPWVATRDIAAKAASFLLSPGGWAGHRIVGVHGPRDYSYSEVVAQISKQLGRQVNYVQVPVEAARQAMLGFGLPEWMANTFAEMYQAINDGRMSCAEPRCPLTTTSTTLPRFIEKVLIPALQKQGGSSAS